MATENERNLEDFAAGFDDERAAPLGDDRAFEMPEGDGAADAGGGMDLDAAAGDAGGKGEDGAVIVAVAEGAPAGAADSAASTGGNPDATAIERQPEGGESAVSSAADNGAGGNESGEADGGTDVAVVIGATGPEDSPLDEPTDPADLQRKRSWEGRLRADEERLKARKAELDDLAAKLEAKGASAGQEPGEATSDALEAVAEKTNDPALIEAAEDMSQRVESGEISPEDAMAQLKEDFGEPFVNMIQTIATAAAGKALEGMRKDVDALRGDADEVIGHLKSRADREHFQAIASEFPDFNEIGKSAEFAAFLDALPPDEKAQAEATKADGSAADVIALLQKFRDSTGDQGGGAPAGEQVAAAPAAAPIPPTAGPDEAEIDAASGVRGGGMQLPSEPGGNDDFAAAWEDAPDVKGRG